MKTADARSYPKEYQLRQLFGFLNESTRTVSTLVSGYITYHGPLWQGHKQLLLERINSCIARDKGTSWPGLTYGEVFGKSGELNSDFLSAHSPMNIRAYLEEATCPVFSSELYGSSHLEFVNMEIPHSLRKATNHSQRPPLQLLYVETAAILATPFSYMSYRETNNCYIPNFSSRALSKRLIKSSERIEYANQIAIIRDQFLGDNFAHFLYDMLPRLLLFCRTMQSIAKRTQFLMSGRQDSLKQQVIEILCSHYGLRNEQFLFTDKPVVLSSQNGVFAFSDQSSPAHPAYLGHPDIIHDIKKFSKHFQRSQAVLKRVYISRSDAPLRRIANEDTLTELVERRGFEIVSLSSLDISEQIGLFTYAETIIGPHGMGLTHIIHSHPGSTLIELFHPTIGTDAYAVMAMGLQIEYRCIIGEASIDSPLDYTISAEKLGAVLDEFSL